jgi:predicted ATPase/DNA-binding SARP family transcriptional activator
VEFRVLGSVEVRHGAAPVELRGRRSRALLVRLLVDAGSVVPLDRLADALWGAQQPDDPRNAIQTAIARLRARLGGDAPLVTRGSGYVLDIGDDQLDARRFERSVAAARRQGTRPEEARRLLVDALALWRGPAYAEFSDGIAHAEALRLEEARLAALESLTAARLSLGEAQAVVGELEALVAEHPLRERLVELRMRALALRDRRPEALAVYRTYRERVVEETGLEPSASIRALQTRIVRGDREEPAPAPRPAPGPAASVRPAPPPARPTELIGREVEVERVRDALGRHRLVTLTGTGGVGKTRLAAEVARLIEGEGLLEVRWVELAPVADPSDVDHVVATALGVDIGGGAPLRRALVTALSTRRSLLVLDNVEHLLDTAAPLVDELVRGCRGLWVLVTSRERLAIDDERVIVVDPLPTEVPGDQATDLAAAVRLFLERAERAGGRAVEQVTTVTEICRELEGLPLAIELAAARTASLAPTDLLALLREGLPTATGTRRGHPQRHRDLWSVVDWSYRLLSTDEQRLLERLGVFAAGFTADDAHVVCADGSWTPERTLDALTVLVERSLVSRPVVTDDGGPGRYRLLHPVRAFARQRSADRGEYPRVADRHGATLTRSAERAAGPPLTEAGRRWLEASLDELREVRRRSLATGDTARIARLVAALYRFDYVRPGAELLGWADDLVAQAEREGVATTPQVWAAAAAAAWRRGDLERAGRLASRGAAASDGPDDAGRILALEALGDVANFAGRLGEAEVAFREQVRLARLHGDPDAEAMGEASVALVLAYGERVDEAIEAAEAAALAARAAGPASRAFACYARGECLATRDPDRAIALVREAAERARDCGAWFVEGVARVTEASLRARSSQPVAALPAFAALLRHWQRSGSWVQQWTTLRNLVDLLVRLGADEAAIAIATAAASDATAGPAFGSASERLTAAVRLAERRSGPDRAAAARAHGRRLTAPEAVALGLRTIEELGEADIEAADGQPVRPGTRADPDRDPTSVRGRSRR